MLSELIEGAWILIKAVPIWVYIAFAALGLISIIKNALK